MSLDSVKAHERAAHTRKYNRIDWFWQENHPYKWQSNWWDAGSSYKFRHNSSANRQGKTFSIGYEVALHALGKYPDWWSGRRFVEPTIGIVAGETTESVRDTIQMTLLGKPGDQGSGWIPKKNILNIVTRHGGGGAVDHIVVKRETLDGGTSTIYLKTYDQGQEKIAGMEAHYFAYDENCPLAYFSEATTRTATTKGIIFGAYTPLEYSDLVSHLEKMHKDDPKSVYLVYVDIEEARHLDAADISAMRAAWAPWEIQARTTGVANRFGKGLVYPVNESLVSVPPMHVPNEWRRLASIDFGMSADPTAIVFRAIDPRTDTTYIYDCYVSESGDSENRVANAVKKQIAGIPVAWPHDGNKQIKGLTTVEIYRRLGFKMLPSHATFMNGSMKVADGVAGIRDKMERGRYKIFSTCRQWFEEYRKYRYDDKGIAKKQDDHVMDADRYGFMMERYAKVGTDIAFGPSDKPNSTDYEVFDNA